MRKSVQRLTIPISAITSLYPDEPSVRQYIRDVVACVVYSPHSF